MKKKLIGYLMIIFLIISDLISKRMITTNIALGERVPLIDDFFWLTNVRNTGAAWSLFDQHTWILAIVSLVAGVGLLIYYHTKQLKKIHSIAFIMIIAGTIGNGIDRLFLGYVRDFLSFNIFGYMFPVFNIADSLLTVGVTILIFYTLIAGDLTHE